MSDGKKKRSREFGNDYDDNDRNPDYIHGTSPPFFPKPVGFRWAPAVSQPGLSLDYEASPAPPPAAPSDYLPTDVPTPPAAVPSPSMAPVVSKSAAAETMMDRISNPPVGNLREIHRGSSVRNDELSEIKFIWLVVRRQPLGNMFDYDLVNHQL